MSGAAQGQAGADQNQNEGGGIGDFLGTIGEAISDLITIIKNSFPCGCGKRPLVQQETTSPSLQVNYLLINPDFELDIDHDCFPAVVGILQGRLNVGFIAQGLNLNVNEVNTILEDNPELFISMVAVILQGIDAETEILLFKELLLAINNEDISVENAEKLIEFLNNNFSQDAIDFALELLEIMEDNSDITWSNMENWFLGEVPGSDSSEIIDPENISYDVPLTQQDLPSMSDFVNYFPKEGTPGNYTEMSTPDVYELVGGTLWHSHQNDTYNNYQNACSIRGSRGLLYSGIDIPVLTYNGSQRTQKGGDNNNYILDAVSFDKFMRDKFGSPTHELTGIDANNSGEVVDFLKDKNGIYVIINSSHTQAGYSGHVDAIIDGECISNAYAAPSGGVKSIAVWELE